MQARFYGPMYHRFLSPDPARDQSFEFTQKWNIYSYVSNSPVMNFDPDGMAEKPGFWAGVWDGIKSYPGQVWQTVRHPIQTAERQQAQRMASVAKHGFLGALTREVGKEFVKALPSGGQLLAAGTAVSQASSGDTHGAGKTLGGQLASDVTALAGAYAGAKLGPMGGGSGAATALDASGAPAGELGMLYRGGGTNPGNMSLRAGEEALSFRDSLSNPWPLAEGAQPVLKPGQPYFGVDATKLPPGAAVADGAAGSAVTPPGHVSVAATPAEIKAAVVEKGKFPN